MRVAWLGSAPRESGHKAEVCALSRRVGVGPSFEMGQDGLGTELVAALSGGAGKPSRVLS